MGSTCWAEDGEDATWRAAVAVRVNLRCWRAKTGHVSLAYSSLSSIPSRQTTPQREAMSAGNYDMNRYSAKAQRASMEKVIINLSKMITILPLLEDIIAEWP